MNFQPQNARSYHAGRSTNPRCHDYSDAGDNIINCSSIFESVNNILKFSLAHFVSNIRYVTYLIVKNVAVLRFKTSVRTYWKCCILGENHRYRYSEMSAIADTTVYDDIRWQSSWIMNLEKLAETDIIKEYASRQSTVFRKLNLKKTSERFFS